MNIKNSFLKIKKKLTPKRIAVLSGLLFAAMLLTAAAVIYIPALTDQTMISIVPTKSGNSGIDVRSEFIIKSKESKNVSDLQKSLTVTGGVPYTIKQDIFGAYRLTFDKPLAAHKVYNFIYKGSAQPVSFAFQTKDRFSVSSTMPADKSQSVDLSTGIEISFTQKPASDYQNYIDITPAVKGSYSLVGKTVVFIPNTLATKTKYIITIKKGFASADGDKLDKDLSFGFDTSTGENTSGFISISGDSVETFLPDENPVVELEACANFNKSDFKVNVMKIDSPEAFGKIFKQCEDNFSKFGYNHNAYQYIDLQGTAVSEFHAKLIDTSVSGNDSGAKYILLPQKLTEGYYAVNIETEYNGKQIKLQKFIQINALSVYMMSDNGSMLVWVNSTLTKKPVKDAEISIDGKAVGKTSQNGTFKVQTGTFHDNSVIFIAPKSGKNYVACTAVFPAKVKTETEKYYSYIYTDREAYLSSDKIRVFGVLKPRNGEKLPTKATLYLSPTDTDNLDARLTSVDVKVDADGVFSGILPVDSLSSEMYNVKLEDASGYITEKSITVDNYVKPLYKIDAKEYKNAYYYYENVPVDAVVTFFDGTPVQNIHFDVSCEGYQTVDAVTDTNGVLHTLLKPIADNEECNSAAETKTIMITGKNAEDKTVSQQMNFILLKSNVIMTTQLTDSGTSENAVIYTNSVTKDRITDFNWAPDDETIRGTARNITVQYSIIKHEYFKKNIVSHYNYIEKKTFETYDYDLRDTVVKAGSFQTVNGEYTLSGLPKSTSDAYYEIKLSSTDTRGQSFCRNIFTDNKDFSSQWNIKQYSFSANKDYNQYTVKKYKAGEMARLSLLDEKGNEVTAGTALYSVMKDGIADFGLSSLPFGLTFKKDYIPNVFICGAYFDGRHAFNVENCMLGYNYESEELKISLKPDRSSYKPGDTVNLAVSVKDQSGRPIKAVLNLSIADEAAFSLYPQTADILGGMYAESFTSGLQSYYVSYRQHDFSGLGGPEQGGEGGPEGIRKDFVDTADFITLKTGVDGKANTSFKLPDNITSWRITAQAVTNDIKAGSTRTDISAGLPLFADMILNRSYLQGDDISLTARAFGTALGNGNVTYTATLSDNSGTVDTKTVTTRSGQYAGINFGSKPVGNYKMTLKAQYGNYSDEIEKSFSVIQNATSLMVTKTFNLRNGININALHSPVKLVLYNKNSSIVYRSLLDMCFGSGERNDELLASSCAASLLSEYSNDSSFDSYSYNYDSGYFQKDDGGAAIYSYASSDPLLTAEFLMADGDSINHGKAKDYFYSIVNNTKGVDKTKIASAYFGLAALKEPVLQDIRVILSEDKLTDKQRLIYACALAAIGDQNGAYDIYKDAFSDKLTHVRDGISYQIGKEQSENDEYNALMLYILTNSDNELAGQVMNHLLNSPSQTFCSALMQLYYDNNTIAKTAQAEIEYKDQGKSQQITLNTLQSKTLLLTTEQIKSAGFIVQNGDVECEAIYVGTSDDTNKSGSVKVIKRIEKSDGSKSAIRVGDNVKISIQISSTVKHSGYTIDDFIPTGMRFVSFDSKQSSNNVSFIRQEQQKASFGIYSNTAADYQIVYTARAVTGGSYTVDSAFVQDKNNEYSYSQRSRITIEKYKG